MIPPSSRQQSSRAPTDALGAPRYEYRYPFAAKAIAIAIVLLIPLSTTAFIQQVVAAPTFNDRLLPLTMALILIGAGVYLAYRQAYFAWTVVTIYERGMRVDFWFKHLVILWSQLGKFYLGPGRVPRWQVVNKDEQILCEIRIGAIGRALGEQSSDPEQAQTPMPTPTITDTIIEQAHLTLYETPFRHYAPPPGGARRSKKAR